MEKLSDRINRLSESQTIAMSRKSRELAAQGHDIINLSLGEPDFDTPDFIKDAAKLAIDNNFTHYTPVPGLLELRQAISIKFKRDNDLEYSPDQIVVSTGAKQSIANIALCLLNDGDEVLIPIPYWVSYLEIIKLAEGTPVFVNSGVDSDFKITPKQLSDAITPKTRMLIFSSPCNPSGSVYTKNELEALAEVLKEHPNIIIVSDEIYEHINFTGEGHWSIGRFDSVKNQVVTVNGVSKAFAMTGWRLGYIGAPEWIAKACSKMQGQITSGTSAITQKASEAAVLSDPRESVEGMKESFLRRRDLILSLMEPIEGVKNNIPEGAFYVFPDVSYYFGKSFNDQMINNSTDLCDFLLNEGHVAVVPGEAFGDPNCIRISYATSEDIIQESISRIKSTLSKLS